MDTLGVWTAQQLLAWPRLHLAVVLDQGVGRRQMYKENALCLPGSNFPVVVCQSNVQMAIIMMFCLINVSEDLC